MAPPKKFKKSTILYSYRADAEIWRDIKEIARLRDESIAEMFDRCIIEYREKYKHMLAGSETVNERR